MEVVCATDLLQRTKKNKNNMKVDLVMIRQVEIAGKKIIKYKMPVFIRHKILSITKLFLLAPQIFYIYPG
jgi:hypothetical protein